MHVYHIKFSKNIFFFTNFEFSQKFSKKSQIFLHIEIVHIRYEWGEVKKVPGNKVLLRYILEQFEFIGTLLRIQQTTDTPPPPLVQVELKRVQKYKFWVSLGELCTGAFCKERTHAYSQKQLCLSLKKTEMIAFNHKALSLRTCIKRAKIKKLMKAWTKCDK